MKIITSENFREASIARDHFLGLIYRLLHEGQIIHSQIYYYPEAFEWLQYLDAQLNSELELELDAELLRLGAALTCVNWIENSYSQESFSERYLHVVARLQDSKFGQTKEFRRFLEAIVQSDNLGEVELSLSAIFELHVRSWWMSQLDVR